MAPSDDLLSEHFRQQKPNEVDEEPSWKDRPQHVLRTDRRRDRPMAVKGESQWLHRGANHGRSRTCAEHKNDRGRGLPHQTGAPGCRLCKVAPETIKHIIVGCKMQEGIHSWNTITKWLA